MSGAGAGLSGIVAGDQAICTVGIGLGLNYRGYDIQDLAAQCTFEEVAYLLLIGQLPSTEELAAFNKKLQSNRTIPDKLKTALELIPGNAHPMDVTRTIASVLGVLEPEAPTNNQLDITIRLIAVFGPAMLYWFHFVKSGLRINGNTAPTDSTSENFLKLYHLKDTVCPVMCKAFDVSLILYAEHDFAASTFAARVTASTLSDFYSCVTSAIGTLRGPLHGGANEAAMAYLEKLHNLNEADDFLNERFKSKQLIMGFGHRVYKKEDPRSPIIKEQSLKLVKGQFGNAQLLAIQERIEKRMWDEKKMFPNLDFYSASCYHQCGIATELFTPIFVISRMTGWASHIFEQRGNNKLIRPISNYTGPQPKKLLPIGQRLSQAKL